MTRKLLTSNKGPNDGLVAAFDTKISIPPYFFTVFYEFKFKKLKAKLFI